MPISDEHTLDFLSHSAEQTRRLGVRLGALLQSGDLICLEGDLGAGKTCLAQGIGRGLGVVEAITSPSFTLIAEYRPPFPAPVLYHVDLYRLNTPIEEAATCGLQEYLQGDGVCLIEWADRIESILPVRRLWVTLRYVQPTKRGIVMRAAGERYDDLLRHFRQSAFGI
jgi:tRNA threonylcarbamoyladenosine biosynthesis protein TsaE